MRYEDGALNCVELVAADGLHLGDRMQHDCSLLFLSNLDVAATWFCSESAEMRENEID